MVNGFSWFAIVCFCGWVDLVYLMVYFFDGCFGLIVGFCWWWFVVLLVVGCFVFLVDCCAGLLFSVVGGMNCG